ncbi:MAG: DUF3341 domain-containing protein [Blastochloris sp.]|nr:DUF3341 domain-containing protein [Blastochloris sp.]
MAGTLSKIHGIGAEFQNAQSLYEAAKKLKSAGFKRWDVYSPYPIHGMDAAMGLPNSKVSFFSLIGGICGATAAFFLIWYTGGVEYPMVVQGKPHFAFEPTFPVFFELTILLTAFFTVGSMFVLNFMPRFYHPVFNWDRFAKVTDDKFYAVIESSDPLFDEVGNKALLEELGGTEVTLIEE